MLWKTIASLELSTWIMDFDIYWVRWNSSFSNLSLMSLRFNLGPLCFAYDFPVTRIKYFVHHILRKFVFDAQNHHIYLRDIPSAFYRPSIVRKNEPNLRRRYWDRFGLGVSSFFLLLRNPFVSITHHISFSFFEGRHLPVFLKLNMSSDSWLWQ